MTYCRPCINESPGVAVTSPVTVVAYGTPAPQGSKRHVGQGDLRELGWPTGVFRFRHKGGDVYGPAERLGDVQ